MGGGTMRAASKLAGIFSTTRGFRGFAAERFPVSSASRKADGFAFPADDTAEDVNLVASKSEAVAPKPCSGVDDWVFAGVEEEEKVAAGAVEPMPRVVFGGVPTLQEAKEATSELTVALQKTYLSSPSSVGYEGSVEAHNGPGPSPSDKQIGSAVPAPAIMAFNFLNESSMAQNVVASIASDPNVWNAVSQNKELQDFLQSQRACFSGGYNLNSMKSVADSDCSSVKRDDDSSERDNRFIDTLQEIKGTVVDMMSNLSDYFQSFFGGNSVNGVFVIPDGTARLNGEALMGRSFMGLAVMAMLVILLKRV